MIGTDFDGDVSLSFSDSISPA